MPEIQVTQEDAGERLDRFLSKHLPLSRAHIQRLIKETRVKINGEEAKTKTIVKVDDIIFYPDDKLQTDQKKETPPILEILYQDDDLLVINKPAGLLVHEAHKDEKRATVVDVLVKLFPKIATVGDDPKRPGIVHRLDKDVSGVMVIAKTQRAFDHLKFQFQARTVGKEYLALVYGALPKDHDTIRLKITRSKIQGRMVARPESQEGKMAETRYDVLLRLPTTTYVGVQIFTGRTHQIRVHFQALGYPVVGDKLYTIKRMKFRPIELNRLFLHAQSLTLRLLDGAEKTFQMPLPEELEQLLRQLQKL